MNGKGEGKGKGDKRKRGRRGRVGWSGGQSGRATNLNLITGPHAQFNRHKGSEWGPYVMLGQ